MSKTMPTIADSRNRIRVQRRPRTRGRPRRRPHRFESTPADLVASRATLIGEHLAAYVST